MRMSAALTTFSDATSETKGNLVLFDKKVDMVLKQMGEGFSDCML